MRGFNKKGLVIILILVIAIILRIYRIDQIPVGLFGDEVDMGYHAYSLLTSGRDYTGHLFPLHLESFADAKAHIFAYTLIPSIAIFGLNEFGIRLPSAFFGVLAVGLTYLLVSKMLGNQRIAQVAAFLLAISPWHLQFSRWGSETMEMLALFLAGLWLFFKSLEKSKYLITSVVCFALCIMTYHSAKVYVPLVLISLIVIYFKEIIKIEKRRLVITSVIFMILTIPFLMDTMFAGGADRFRGTSIFNSSTIEGELGADRVRDKEMVASEGQTFLSSEVSAKLNHNKVGFFGNKLVNNYLQSFSTEFLFINGDTTPRHNSSGGGQLYKYQAVLLIAGLVVLFLKFKDKRLRWLLILLTVLAPVPSMITDGGGTHATRLIFLVIPLTIFSAIGAQGIFELLNKKLQKVYILILTLVVLVCFLTFQHHYLTHAPWDYQKWWHAGYKGAIQSVVEEGRNYDKVIISSADEPSMIFFLFFAKYLPDRFREEYYQDKIELENFGQVVKLGKYYFPGIGVSKGLYDLGNILPDNSLYLATSKEIVLDLIKEPNRVPDSLRLIKSIPYPSGAGVFYLFTKK